MREFGSEFQPIELPDGYFDKIVLSFTDYAYLRTGRESLSFVAQNISPNPECILLPMYCCDSMILPFRNLNWTVHFYELNEDLTINCKYLVSLIEEVKPKTILVMNFFGISDTKNAIDELKSIKSDIIIIEDFTHCLFNLSNIYNPNVDYYSASIRKWIGVNDGGILLSKKALQNKPIFKENDFVTLRNRAQLLKSKYLITNNKTLKTEYREKLGSAEEIINFDTQVMGISEKSLLLLKTLNVENIGFKRQENFIHLLNRIKNISKIRFLLNVEIALHLFPFTLPILVEDRDEKQKELASKGLYAPVLWPLNEKIYEMNSDISVHIANSILCIPIDQRYDYNDIEDIATIIHSVF